MSSPPPPPPPPQQSQQNGVDGYPPRARSPGNRSLSPPPRRSSSRDRYYEESRRPYRDDYHRDRYDYPRRDYYDRGYDRDRYYDRYRDRYDRDRYYDDRRSRYPPKPRPRRPVERGTEQDRKNTSTIYAGNLPYDFVERDVIAMFERYGRIKSVTVPMDTVTNKNKGFAFVEFEDRRDAEEAFDKFNGFSVEGRRLRLDWDIGLSKKGDGRSRRGPPPPPLERDRGDPRDRPLNGYAAPPPPPPPMDRYRRDSPEPYRR